MRFEIRYFAAVREKLGTSGETLDLPDHDTLDLDTLWRILCQRHPQLTPMRRHLRVGINLEFADGDEVRIADGDEVALIPPVAGGTTLVDAPALLCSGPIDEAAVLAAVERPEAGAVVSFRGVVRNHSQGRPVAWLEYEVYPAMAKAKLRQVIAEIEKEHPEVRCALVHRHGRLEIGDAAVFIAVSSPHRAVAFAACARAIDRIKEIVPIWKREVGPDGAVWVGMGS